jgi:uncharacterized protein YegJ (DUF2314 family)
MRTLTIILTLISVVCFGQTDKTERQGEPDIYNVESDDKEMNEAIKKSRLSFDDFLTTFKNKKRSQSSFSIKMPFPTNYGAEHIWLVNIESKNGKLFGQVDNVPESVTSIKLGDKIEIDRNKISDWFYIEDNKLIGGLTIRVIRDRMTPLEKRQFDREFGVTF